MTAFTIRLIAFSTMAIDHIGLFFFPDILIFRVIGRISFPLFAWLIANGAYFTKNIKKYLLRLFLLAIFSQPFFLAAHRLYNPSFFALNIVFTLFFGLLAIFLIRKTKKNYLKFFIFIFLSLTAHLIKAEYRAFGVISILIFYHFFNDLPKMFLLQSSNLILFFILPSIFFRWENPILFFWNFVQLFSLTSFFFIACYNQKEGKKAKYLFYLFYPLQYIVIYLLNIGL